MSLVEYCIDTTQSGLKCSKRKQYEKWRREIEQENNICVKMAIRFECRHTSLWMDSGKKRAFTRAIKNIKKKKSHSDGSVLYLHVWWCFEKMLSSIRFNILFGIDWQLSVGIDGYQHLTNVCLRKCVFEM